MTTEIQLANPRTVAGISLPPSIAGRLRENFSHATGLISSFTFHNEWDTDSFDIVEIRAGYDKICAEIENCKDGIQKDELKKLLALMYATTRKQKEDQLTLNLATAAYGQKLMAYPADLVRPILETWSDKHEFWPSSWKVLKDEIEAMDDRQKLNSAFRTMLNQLGVPFSELR